MAINKGPGNGEQIVSIMQGYNNKTNVTTDNHNSIILGSANVIGDRLNALVVGDGHLVENDGIATTNLTVTSTLNGRAVSDILPTYTKYVALITQSSTSAPTVIELENTIGPIVWTRANVGDYNATLTGAFDNTKTYLQYNRSDGTFRVLNINTILLTSISGGVLADGVLNNSSIEIRIYP